MESRQMARKSNLYLKNIFAPVKKNQIFILNRFLSLNLFLPFTNYYRELSLMVEKH